VRARGSGILKVNIDAGFFANLNIVSGELVLEIKLGVLC